MSMASAREARLKKILGELGRIGVVLPGSISDRTTRCQKEGCHCRADPARLHGPYHTWTWRWRGVSMTKTLTDGQAEQLAPYAGAHRRLRQLVSELEVLSLELIEERHGTDFGRAHMVGNRSAEAGE